MPISSWFKDSLNDYIKDILFSKNAKKYMTTWNIMSKKLLIIMI